MGGVKTYGNVSQSTKKYSQMRLSMYRLSSTTPNWRSATVVVGVMFLCFWSFSLWKTGEHTFQVPRPIRVTYGVSNASPMSFLQNSSSNLKRTDASPCWPKHRIVYVKTHKTGSSTITTILERYGYRQDLNFALPIKTHTFLQTAKFNPSSVYQHDLRDKNGTLVWQALGGFHILANHARYNRETLESLFPNATYFTIMRDPVSQLESAFEYFSLDRILLHTNSENALKIFLADPMRFFNSSKPPRWPVVQARNGQIYDLGLDHKHHDDSEFVDDTIKSVSEEMDLVLINEYFDESLILLKKLLCWDFDDVIYISKGVRQATVRRNITTEMRYAIENWNSVDVKLYQHFNKTFWKKVYNYGPSFKHDLAIFRKLKTLVTEHCLANATIYSNSHKENLFKLSATASEKCRDLVRYDHDWVRMIRNHMAEKSAVFVNRHRQDRVQGNSKMSARIK